MNLSVGNPSFLLQQTNTLARTRLCLWLCFFFHCSKQTHSRSPDFVTGLVHKPEQVTLQVLEHKVQVVCILHKTMETPKVQVILHVVEKHKVQVILHETMETQHSI